MKFACFGAAAVADEAVAAATRHGRRGTTKFLFGSKADKPTSQQTKTKGTTSSPGRRREMTDFDIYMAAAAARKSSAPSTSSSALSTAASLDSACTSSSSSISSCSRSSSSSSLSSLADETPPHQPAKRPPQQQGKRKRSPALGPAAVLVCLVMMVFGGRLVATLLTAAVLAFFPRQCPAAHRPAPASRREAIDATAVIRSFPVRNRNK